MNFQDFLKTKQVADFDKLAIEKQAELHNEFISEVQKNLNDAITTKASKEDIANLKNVFNETLQKLDVSLKQVLQKQGEEIIVLKKKGLDMLDKGKTPKEYIQENIKEIAMKIKSLHSTQEYALSIFDQAQMNTKAVVSQPSVIGNAFAQEIPGVGLLGHKVLTLQNIFRTYNLGNDDNGKVRYYDFEETEIVRGAIPVSRQEAFGESKAVWKKFEVDLKKIGDSIPVDEEFFEDAQLFYNTIDGFLQQNVALEWERQLAVGNTSVNSKETDGILTYALQHTPTPQGIDDASIYDLLVDMKTDITRTKGSKFRPNAAMMNSTTFNKMRFKKDDNKNYVIPPFVSADSRNVDGLSVVIVDEFPNGTIVVGDASLATIYQKGGVVLSKGEVNDQFIEDMFTLKIRKRGLLLVRNIDKAGFRKVTDIEAALAILESNPTS